MGGVVYFAESLVAIAGFTRKVEIYANGYWDDEVIPAVGNVNGILQGFGSLVIANSLYIFGNILCLA
mgnify:CR=1 FL=1